MAKKIKKNKKPGDIALGGGRVGRVVNVANAYGHGTDQQVKIQDTIGNLLRRGHISQAEYAAAMKYQAAFEATSAISSVLDPSKSGGGGFGPRSKSEYVLAAAETLSRARLWLGIMTGFIVEKVVGEGYSIEHVAGMIYKSATRRQVDKVGADLRESLSVLAAKWFGRYGKNHTETVKAILALDARPTMISVGEIELGGVAHAGRDSSGKFSISRQG